MTIAKSSRGNLRNHRKSILIALAEYANQVYEKIGLRAEMVPIKILKSVRATRIRLSRSILPNEFIQLVLTENNSKKYKIEFCQKHTDFIEIILQDKPLIAEGQGILFFFFRELLQYLEKKNSKKIIPLHRKATMTVAQA